MLQDFVCYVGGADKPEFLTNGAPRTAASGETRPFSAPLTNDWFWEEQTLGSTYQCAATITEHRA
jgi:hypothetical protein